MFKEQAKNAMSELIKEASLKEGQIVVLGCSTSEVMGETIGKGSAFDAGKEIIEGVFEALCGTGIFLAVGCCEHLNRAVIIEREAAEKYNLEIVCAVPAPKAGGSAATAAWYKMKEPCAVEFVKAHAGMDVGNTLIGMHLKHVAVPLRLKKNKIGKANLTFAKTRPKFIGGERTHYTEE